MPTLSIHRLFDFKILGSALLALSVIASIACTSRPEGRQVVQAGAGTSSTPTAGSSTGGQGTGGVGGLGMGGLGMGGLGTGGLAMGGMGAVVGQDDPSCTA